MNQPVIIPIHESSADGESTFTDGEGAAGFAEGRLGGVGVGCVICAEASVALAGTGGGASMTAD
jgi:hypothetical protein